MANQIAEFFARVFLKNEISPELDNIIDELLHLNKVIENSKHPEMLVQEKARVEELTKSFLDAGGQAKELSQILTYQGAQGVSKFNTEVENLTNNSYNNFRAIGQMDRVTREFASGGLNQGLNGLTMFGNSLTRLAVQEGGFKNAISGLAGAFTGPAGIVLALSAAVGIFEQWQKSTKKAEEETLKFSKSLDDAKKSGLETGLRLQTLVQISEDASLSDKKRAEALSAVKKELGGVNKELADQIKTSDDAKKAVDIYTQALIQQAIVTARMGKIAADTIALESSQTTIKKSKPSDIGKVLALQGTEQLGGQAGLGASLLIKALGLSDLSDAINESKRLQKDLDTQTEAIQNDLSNLKKNPFGIALLTGQEGENKELDKSLQEKNRLLEYDIKQTEKWFNEQLKLSEKIRLLSRKTLNVDYIDTLPSKKIDEAKSNLPDFFLKENNQINPAEEKITKEMPLWIREDTAARSENDAMIKKQYEDSKQFSNFLSKTFTNDLMGLWESMQKGEDIGPVIGDMFAKLAEQIAAAAIQAAIFAVIMESLGYGGEGNSFGDIFGKIIGIPKKHAEGGITTGPSLGIIGEAGPEAIMPLSKLGNVMNNSFNAGAINGNGNSNNGQFVLKGNDLVLALNRSNVSLNLRRGA